VNADELTADEITRIANRGILPTRESKAYRKGFHAGHAAAKEVAQVEAAALRTQLEQAHQRIAELQEWVTEPAEARETALREALEECDKAWEDDNLADLMDSLGYQWHRALSGEGSNQ
jgi:hypothetical protein